MVQAKDIIVVGSEYIAEDDTVQANGIGGSADKAVKMMFAKMTATGQVEAVSSSASDTTQTITVHGRNAAGEKVSEEIDLNGQTPAQAGTPISFERIMKALKKSAASTVGWVAVMAVANEHSGTALAGGDDYIDLAAAASATDNAYDFMVVRITGGTGSGQIRMVERYVGGTTKRAYVWDWDTNPDGTSTYEIAVGLVFDKWSTEEIKTVRRACYDAAANAEGGAEKRVYEKVHILNRNAESPAKAVTNAQVAEVQSGLEGGSTVNVSGATNASPIVITTAASHGFSTGDRVRIADVLGNTAANGSWTITVVDADEFSLDGSTGNGAYTSGGTVKLEVVQFGLESALNDSNTNGSNKTRLEAPAGITFNSAAKTIAAGNFTPASSIGVWIEYILPAGSAAKNDYWYHQVLGQST